MSPGYLIICLSNQNKFHFHHFSKQTNKQTTTLIPKNIIIILFNFQGPVKLLNKCPQFIITSAAVVAITTTRTKYMSLSAKRELYHLSREIVMTRQRLPPFKRQLLTCNIYLVQRKFLGEVC